MALKAVLENAPPEGLKEHYVEKEGRWHLQAEGVVPEEEYLRTKVKLNEFRDNNVSLLKKIDQELQPKLHQFDGVDPEEYKALKAEKEKLAKTGVTAAEDVGALIARSVDAAVKPLKETIQRQETERAKLTEEVITREFDKRLVEVAVDKGVDPVFAQDVIERAHKVFKYIDGKIQARTADGGLAYDNRGEPLSIEAWVPDIPKPFYRQSSGGGALPGGSTPKTTAKQLVNPTPSEMGAHMDAIIKGEMVVVRH
jgi:hypothetical protein